MEENIEFMAGDIVVHKLNPASEFVILGDSDGGFVYKGFKCRQFRDGQFYLIDLYPHEILPKPEV